MMQAITKDLQDWGVPDSDIRTYEVTFCSCVAGWVNALFGKYPEWPFRRAEFEESKAIKGNNSAIFILAMQISPSQFRPSELN